MTNYSPAEVENLTNWTPEGQRDLRRKGYLDNYGVQHNGRWRYSPRDIAAFWVASELNDLHHHGGGLDLRTSLATASTNAPTLIDLICERSAPRYVVFLSYSLRENSTDGMTLGGSEVKRLSDLTELSNFRFDDAYLIDLKQLADTAPADVRDAVTAE